LARKELTIENDTDPNKQKSSRRQRLREENEGEDKGGGKKKAHEPRGSCERRGEHLRDHG
jgi:hypothetical protein